MALVVTSGGTVLSEVVVGAVVAWEEDPDGAPAVDPRAPSWLAVVPAGAEDLSDRPIARACSRSARAASRWAFAHDGSHDETTEEIPPERAFSCEEATPLTAATIPTTTAVAKRTRHRARWRRWGLTRGRVEVRDLGARCREGEEWWGTSDLPIA